jgi:hypothetical protein
MALNRYSNSRKKETMPIYGHIFVGMIMFGFVAACLGYGSLAYLNYRTEKQEEITRNALIEQGNRQIEQEKEKIRQKAMYYEKVIQGKWGKISGKDAECQINTLTNDRVCRKK